MAFSPAGKDRLPERRPLLPFLLFMFWGLPSRIRIPFWSLRPVCLQTRSSFRDGGLEATRLHVNKPGYTLRFTPSLVAGLS